MAIYTFEELAQKLTTLAQMKEFSDFDQNVMREIHKEVRKVCSEANEFTTKKREDLLEEARQSLQTDSAATSVTAAAAAAAASERERRLLSQLQSVQQQLEEEKLKAAAAAAAAVSESNPNPRKRAKAKPIGNPAFWTECLEDLRERFRDIPISKACCDIPAVNLFPRICEAALHNKKWNNLVEEVDEGILSTWMCLAQVEAGEEMAVPEAGCPHHPEGGCVQIRVVEEDGRRCMDIRQGAGTA